MAYYHGLVSQPDCLSCPLRYDKKVLPDGPIPAKIILIGEGPGGVECQQGKGFVGLSGKLLWFLMKHAGITCREEQIWVTNATLCRKRDVRLTTGAMLSEEQVQGYAVKACRQRLIQEIKYVAQGNENAVIIPVGR